MSPDEIQRPPAGVAVAALARWALVAGMAIVAVGSLLYARGAFDPSRAVAGGGGGEARATRYHCPMHPQIVRDKPGECPICGMTLVPIVPSGSTPPAPAGSPSSPSSSLAVPGLVPVQLTADRIQLAGVKTAKVVRQSIGSGLSAAGVVVASERGLAEVNTRFAGWIQQLLVSETGRRVKRGEALATIYSPDVLSAQQEFLTARRWSLEPGRGAGRAVAGVAEEEGEGPGGPARGAGALSHTHGGLTAGMADDARKRLDLLGVGAQDIDEIARTGQPLRAITIRAPISGTIIRRGAVPGSYVQPGSELYAIADLSTVWFIAEIPEHDIGRVRLGQGARIVLAALPGAATAIKGRVQFLYPAVDADTRAMRVRVEVRNVGDKLRPGMYGTLHLDLGGAPALTVPDEAVVDTGATQYLFVAKAGGRFEPRRVTVGAHGDGVVEILTGVTDGETVVTTANFLIDSESRLRAAVEGTR